MHKFARFFLFQTFGTLGRISRPKRGGIGRFQKFPSTFGRLKCRSKIGSKIRSFSCLQLQQDTPHNQLYESPNENETPPMPGYYCLFFLDFLVEISSVSSSHDWQCFFVWVFLFGPSILMLRKDRHPDGG